MRWTAPSSLTVDTACSAWLIRRFIDPEARFAFADRAPPFDEPRFGFDPPVPGTGERTTFAALLVAHDISDRALARVAEIVHLATRDLDEYSHDDALRLDTACRGLTMIHDGHRALELVGVMMDDLYSAVAAE